MSSVSPHLPTLKYVRLEHAMLSRTEYVVVNWCLGNTCNYSCSYCPEILHSGSVAWPKLEEMKKAVKKIVDHYSPRKIYFEFTGGEVTLWKDLSALCDYLKELGCRVGIISNASKSLDFWNELRTKIDHICCSFHWEKGDPEHFLKVIRTLSENVRTHVNIMMLPEKFDSLIELAEKITEVPNITMALQPLIKDFQNEVYPYSPEQLEVFQRQHEIFSRKIKTTKQYEYYRGSMAQVSEDGTRKVISAYQMISAGENNWQNWDCYAGVEQIVVSLEGQVFRGWCYVGGSLGSVFSEGIRFPQLPVRCDKNYCTCNFDIMSTKERPGASISSSLEK